MNEPVGGGGGWGGFRFSTTVREQRVDELCHNPNIYSVYGCVLRAVVPRVVGVTVGVRVSASVGESVWVANSVVEALGERCC